MERKPPRPNASGDQLGGSGRAKRKGLGRWLARWKGALVQPSPAVRSAARKSAALTRKTAKAVVEPSAQLATSSTFAKRRTIKTSSQLSYPASRSVFRAIYYSGGAELPEAEFRTAARDSVLQRNLQLPQNLL